MKTYIDGLNKTKARNSRELITYLTYGLICVIILLVTIFEYGFPFPQMVIEDPEARMTFFIICAFVGFITPFVLPQFNHKRILFLSDMPYNENIKNIINEIKSKDKKIIVYFTIAKPHYEDSIKKLARTSDFTYIYGSPTISNNMKKILNIINKRPTKAKIYWHNKPNNFDYEAIKMSKFNYKYIIFIIWSYSMLFLFFGFVALSLALHTIEPDKTMSNSYTTFLLILSGLTCGIPLYAFRKKVKILYLKSFTYYNNFKNIGQKPKFKFTKRQSQ